MLSKIMRPAVLLAVFSATFCATGADYKAGEAEPFKKWPVRDFEGAKTASMPLLVYFYDAEIRRNDYAKFLETKVLGSAELKDKLKPFLVLKVKTDGTDVKGWPAEWLFKAKNAAAIMLCNSEMTQMMFYDKSMPKEAITSHAVMGQMAGILMFEEKKKGSPTAARKDDKAAMPPVAENKPLPGLNLDKDKDKKDEKKPPEKKKVAAPSDE